MGENTLLHAGILLFGVFVGAISQVMLKRPPRSTTIPFCAST